VGVTLALPDAGTTTLRLVPEPRPNDPAGGARFVSPPGPLALDRVIGELTATLGGRSFTREFHSR
jgi:hypothetical protein